jgi:hypothetical protein
VNPKSWCKTWTEHGFSLGSSMGFVTSKNSIGCHEFETDLPRMWVLELMK